MPTTATRTEPRIHRIGGAVVMSTDRWQRVAGVALDRAAKAPSHPSPSPVHVQDTAGGVAPAAILKACFADDPEAPATKASGEPAPDRALWWTVSTEARDRDNDRIMVAGWDLKNYRKNPVVLWAHDYHSPPIGKAIDFEVDAAKGRLRLLKQFMPAEISPFAETVYQMAKGGFLKAASVGFIPRDYEPDPELKQDDGSFLSRGYLIKKAELLESSIVPIPSNPTALQGAKGFDLAPLIEWGEKMLDGETTLIVPRTEVEGLLSAIRPAKMSRALSAPPTDEKAPATATALATTESAPITTAQAPAIARAPNVSASTAEAQTKAITTAVDAKAAIEDVAEWLFTSPALTPADKARLRATKALLCEALAFCCGDASEPAETPELGGERAIDPFFVVGLSDEPTADEHPPTQPPSPTQDQKTGSVTMLDVELLRECIREEFAPRA